MTVTIVGEDPSVYKEVTCAHCASILRYSPMDVKEYYTSDYSGDEELVKYIVCPKCSYRVNLEKWPSGLRR